MIQKHTLTLTRRDFSIAALSASIALGLKIPLAARERDAVQADALMQLMPSGTVVIYSGGGHMGPYGDPRMQHVLSGELELDPQRVTFDLSGNPAHLPGMLGQCCHHMSFTNRGTNLKAASKLKNISSDKLSDGVRYFIEDGVSDKTREMAYALDPVGIIVAVRQLS